MDILKTIKQLKRIEIYKTINKYEDEIYLDASIVDELTYRDVHTFLLENALIKRKQRQFAKFTNKITIELDKDADFCLI